MPNRESLRDAVAAVSGEVQDFITISANTTGGLSMTREDRKSKNAINYPASVLTWLNEVTDGIYDDFESRTCGNCKHLNELGIDGNGTGRCVEEEPHFIVDTDFGCNKFERTV